MLPYIYPELYEHILRQLPVRGCGDEDDDEDVGARALAQCAAANSTLRGIACLSHIWKPHFEARWSHHSPRRSASTAVAATVSSSSTSSHSVSAQPSTSTSQDNQPHTVSWNDSGRPRSPSLAIPISPRSILRHTGRRPSSSASAPDYYHMYIERALKDNRVLDALDSLVLDKTARYELSLEIVNELGVDVWDAVESQKRLLGAPDSFLEEDAPREDWFARAHWVDEIIGAMTRKDAVERAIRLANGEDMSLEEGLSIFSGFWGIEYPEISRKFDLLANQFRAHLEANKHELDPTSTKYDRIAIVLELCSWMHEQGFLPAVDTYHDLRNHYLHKVLTSHRKTLPLSLVSVFCALAQRLGIPASAVGFPGHVHAFVPLLSELAPRSPYASYYDALQRGIHLDVYHSARQPFIDIMQSVRNDNREHLKIASTHDMVLRAGKNILTSAQLHQTEISSWELDLSVYGVFCVFLLEQQHLRTPAKDFINHIVAIVSQSYPLDVGPILLKRLVPALSGVASDMLESECLKLVNDDSAPAEVADRKPVRYFSGLVFVHRIFDYIAVILEGNDHCHASNAWIIRFGIDSLERGRHQPFYSVCAADGSSRYVAEDNIIPIARLVAQHDPEFSTHVGRAPGDILRSLVEGFSSLGRHFLRPVEGKEGRLVFVPHPETLIRFPDEEAKAKAYLEKGEW